MRLIFGVHDIDRRDAALFFQLDSVLLGAAGAIAEHFGDIAKKALVFIRLLILGVMDEVEPVRAILVDDFHLHAPQRLIDLGPGDIERRLHFNQWHVGGVFSQHRGRVTLAGSHGLGRIRIHLGARGWRGFPIGWGRSGIIGRSRRLPGGTTTTADAIDGRRGQIGRDLQGRNFGAVLILLLLIRKPALDGAASTKKGGSGDDQYGARGNAITHDELPQKRQPGARPHERPHDTVEKARSAADGCPARSGPFPPRPTSREWGWIR